MRPRKVSALLNLTVINDGTNIVVAGHVGGLHAQGKKTEEEKNEAGRDEAGRFSPGSEAAKEVRIGYDLRSEQQQQC